jgi:adenylate cyclase
MAAPKLTAGTSEWWRAVLTDPAYHFAGFRSAFRRLPSPPHCKICGAPFRGFGGAVMGPLGFRPWDKNPTICRLCIAEIAKYPPGGAEIDCTLLFADIRSSTGLAEQSSAADFAALLRRFYETGSAAVIAENGVVDKFVGDEVVALFIPAFTAHHALAALRAARRMLASTGYGQPSGPWLPVGIGVHSGAAFVGSVAVGGAISDFTALGDTVNLAARLASAAGPGEVLVSEATLASAGKDGSALELRDLTLRGHEASLPVRVADHDSLGPLAG